MGDYAEIERMKALGIPVPRTFRQKLWLGLGIVVGAAGLFWIATARAQAPIQMSPSQAALGIEQMVGQLAQLTDRVIQENTTLKQQLDEAKKQLAEANKKAAPPPVAKPIVPPPPPAAVPLPPPPPPANVHPKDLPPHAKRKP